MRANRYVSYLGTEIEPNALSTLARFERATDRAFDRIDRFNARGSSRLGVGIGAGFDRSTRSIDTTSTSLDRVRAAAARTDPALGRTTAQANAMAAAMQRSAQALNVVQGPLGPLAGRLGALSVIFRDLAGLSLAAVLGGGGAFAIGNIASGYQQVTDRLRPFYDTQQQANSAMRDVIKIARDTRQELDPVAQLYSRLAQAGKDAGVNAPTARLAETVAKAARLSGGNQQTQSAGIGQFIQGYGSGTLSGEELKSIRENTFRLAKAIADGLGVPIAKLKELGAEGKLTPQIVAEALTRSADTIDKEFQRLALRPGQAITQATNNLAIFLGRMDQATGATQGFAKAIMLMGNNIPTLTVGLVGLTTVFAVRSLAGPIGAATTALERFIATNRMLSQARRGAPVTPLTPTGMERARAATAVETAAVEQRSADARLRAERASLFTAEQRLATARAAQAVTMQDLRAAEANSQRGVVMANARLSMAQREVQLATQAAAVRRAADMEAARAQLNQARAAMAAARSAEASANQRLIAANLAAASPGTGSRADQRRAAATAARAQAVAEAELRTAQNSSATAAARLTAAQAELNAARAAGRAPTAALTAAAAELTAAENALAAATVRETEARAANTAAAGVAARQGFAMLSIVQARVLAEQRLAAAQAASTAAAAALAAATTRLTVAQMAFNAASALGARALAGLQRAGAALSAMLGGPLGIAITAAVVGFTVLAMRTNYAREAIDNFNGGQEELQRRLGLTIERLATASAGAQALAVSLAQADLAENKMKAKRTGGQLAGSLSAAATNIGAFKNTADRKRLLEIAAAAEKGLGLSPKAVADILAIRERNQGAFKSGLLQRLSGMDAGKVTEQIYGTQAATVSAIDSAQNVRNVQRAVAEASKNKLKPIDFDGPSRRTPEQLAAEAGDIATGGTALAQARKDFTRQKADLDAELAKRRKAGDFTFDDEYVQKLAAATSKLNAIGDSQRAAAGGALAHNKAVREQTAALKEAESNANKLNQITTRYQDEPSAVRRGELDQDAVDNLFMRIKDGKAEILETIQLLNSETGKLEPFTQADAQKVKENIERGVRKPIRDAIESQERELGISKLMLAGRATEAELLQQKYDLVSRVGDITEDELDTLRTNAERQREINQMIEQRTRLVDLQARAYGQMQDSLTDLYQNGSKIAGGLIGGAGGAISALLGGKNLGAGAKAGAGNNFDGLKDFATGLMDNFSRALAEKWSLDMFGDKEQEMRDALTRAIDASAGNLTTSADNLSISAERLTEAATAIVAGASGAPIPGMPASAGASNWTSDIKETFEHFGDAFGDEIVVIGDRIKDAVGSRKPDPANMSIEKRYNQMGKEFGAKLFGAASPLTKAAGKLGTFLSGAQYAPVSQGIAGMLGGKGSNLGATLGSGLGKALLGGSGGLLAQGLGSISSSLGSFAGPIGSVLGGVAGSLVSGLFKKTERSNSTVTNGDVSTTASSSSLKANAGGLGGQVSSGVDRIAEALGGSVGNYKVSIGTFDGKYRVSTTGFTGSLDSKKAKGQGLKDFGEDGAAAAVQYAIMDAIQDGAVKGIRAGAQRLLQAGADLDKALQNALDFQNVFRDLKRYTDPVGAAVDDLNSQFERLIDLFNQAGASTSEFQDLQKLYDLKRADAVKEATNGALSNVQDFIDNLKGSADSPLGRRTAYNNASAKVDTFRADLAAGKVVDTDKLLDALSDKQETSRNLNGSRGAFYTDFEDILALAEKAKANIGSASSAGGALPASPFDDPAVKAHLGATADNTAALLPVIRNGLGEVVTAIRGVGGGAGSPNGSSMSYLPSALERRQLVNSNY